MTISAKIIADSITEWGQRITTFELEYPRYIHSEFMTHRLFSRNAASSRAIPVEKANDILMTNPAMPSRWGKNQSGMKAKAEEIDDPAHAESIWLMTRDAAMAAAAKLKKLGLHKQWANRLTEPYTHIKVVCTATEYDNFFWLRCHPDAQPEIQDLAEKMWALYQANEPVLLKEGEWHLPYYGDGYWKDTDTLPLEIARKISASHCAQVSYRLANDSVEKALELYDRLVNTKPVHASPFEHQATPIGWVSEDNIYALLFPDGVTHYRPSYSAESLHQDLWSGNFRGWIQYRQLIDGSTCWDYNG